MKKDQKRNILSILFACVLVFITNIVHADEILPSWNNGQAKAAIVGFVAKVTKEGSPDFVPVAERIATFDNDGTLWGEMPMPVQLYFALDRVRAIAPQHPEWKDKEPFASLLKGDVKGAFAGGEQSLMEIIAATHSGMTTEEFDKSAKDWFATAKNPKTGRPVTESVYQPMLELLAYLRANGFKTFIVSGGGSEFMRAMSEKVYGIAPEQVIGSSGKLSYEMRDGKPVLVKLPKVDFIDNKEGKAIGIQSHIGRRPIAAFGNSDGDLQMLQWATGGSGARFALLINHNDAKREFDYAAGAPAGIKISDATMAEAMKKGWTVVSMKDDWKNVFPSPKQ